MTETTEFAEFAVAQTPRLLRLARVLTRNEHDAWDLVQDCLIRVGARWKRVDHSYDPAAYARKTLVNLNLNRLRRLRREWLTADVPDSAAPTAERNDLLDAVRALPPRQQTVVVLRFYEDMAIRDIAAAMGCTVATVKTHLARAKRTLNVTLRSDGSPANGYSRR